MLGNPTSLTFCEVRRFDVRGTVSVAAGQPSQPATYVIQLSMRSPADGKRPVGASTAARRSDGTFAFERLPVETLFLEASAEKPHIVIGIYRYDTAAACPAAAFLGQNGTLVKSADSQQWKRFQVTGSHITGLSITVPPNFDWTPLHKCI